VGEYGYDVIRCLTDSLLPDLFLRVYWIWDTRSAKAPNKHKYSVQWRFHFW